MNTRGSQFLKNRLEAVILIWIKTLKCNFPFRYFTMDDLCGKCNLKASMNLNAERIKKNGESGLE